MRLILSAVLAAGMAVPGAAQDEWAVSYSLEQIEAYYALYGPARLVQAQIILREGGRYDGPLDGQWGPGTAEAFESVVETLIAINGTNYAVVRRPDDVPSVTDWVANVILAEGGYQEHPD